MFYGGLFQTLQSGKRSAKGVFEVRLKGSSFKNCTAKKKSKKASISRRTQAQDPAPQRQRQGPLPHAAGRYSSATVRGTVWTVTDRCDGTLTQVRRGRVDGARPPQEEEQLMRAGKSYLARAPG